MPCVTRLRRICSRNRSGILPSAANLLHGTGPCAESCASCNVALTAYETVRESFIGENPFLDFCARAGLSSGRPLQPFRPSICGAQVIDASVLAAVVKHDSSHIRD